VLLLFAPYIITSRINKTEEKKAVMSEVVIKSNFGGSKSAAAFLKLNLYLIKRRREMWYYRRDSLCIKIFEL
jgi:hypothetical protein